jgi:hypothetical protein
MRVTVTGVRRLGHQGTWTIEGYIPHVRHFATTSVPNVTIARSTVQDPRRGDGVDRDGLL